MKKVLRSLPLIFDSKIYAIEKMRNLDDLTMDELHRIIIVYKMRIEKDNE